MRVSCCSFLAEVEEVEVGGEEEDFGDWLIIVRGALENEKKK